MFAGTKVVPRILAIVAKTRERDLFVLTVFLLCFGIAWALSLADISLALGAFLAGIVVAGSEFRHQALSDLIPTREVFTSLFFVSVGMLLNISELADQILPVLAILASILLGKFILIVLTALVLRANLRVAILTAATLSQVGEFSFVLLKAASGTGLIDLQLSHNLLAAIILSMVITPLTIAMAPHLALRASQLSKLKRLFGERNSEEEQTLSVEGQVLVAGYGMAGQAVCQLLREKELPYMVVDMNPNNAQLAKNAGDPIVIGDVTQHELLEELHIHSASLAVLCINDMRATERTARILRNLDPDLLILARGQYQTDEDVLRKAGASEVLSAERAATVEMVEKTTQLLSPRFSRPQIAS